jgi:hypothetical protein
MYASSYNAIAHNITLGAFTLCISDEADFLQKKNDAMRVLQITPVNLHVSPRGPVIPFVVAVKDGGYLGLELVVEELLFVVCSGDESIFDANVVLYFLVSFFVNAVYDQDDPCEK